MKWHFQCCGVNLPHNLPHKASSLRRDNPVHAVAEDTGAKIAAALKAKPRKAKIVAFREAQG
jgi:hypothetical protein